jgi:prepilin-type N-terminal cleavage/methylation domain-containing protein
LSAPQGPLKRGLQPGGFSLIEIMLAVALMTIIMLGLLAMFYQTQRAMRVGTAQVDVMSTGDAVMQMIARELKETTAGNVDSVNLFTTNRYVVLEMPRSFGNPQTNYLKDLFFLRRLHDEWVGTGYYIEPIANDGGAGVLYRFENRIGVWENQPNDLLFDQFQNPDPKMVHRLADRVTHFQIRAFNADGSNIFGNGRFANRNNLGDLHFEERLVPAYLDVELGVLEPKAYDRFRARYDTNNVAASTTVAFNYLSEQVDRMHLFRQRIPIRTVSTNQ